MIKARKLGHLVMNVSNLAASRDFYCTALGMEVMSENAPGKIVFLSLGEQHHDLALVENPSLPPPPAEWSMFDTPLAVNHIAITLPSREAWLEQVAYVRTRGVKFDRRVNHGMTHSLYIHDPNGYGVEFVYDLPREVWEGVPVPPNPDLAVLRDRVAAAGGVWRQLRAGDVIATDDVELSVWHPPPPDWERQQVRNDDSLVLSLRYRHVEVLLTGDAAGEFENQFDARFDESARRGGLGDQVRLRVLKVAHHGSRTSSSRRFVERYRPDVALVSAGVGNLFGHPAPEVLATLEQARAELFRTDLDGAVLLETDGTWIDVRTVSGRRRVVFRLGLGRPANARTP